MLEECLVELSSRRCRSVRPCSSSASATSARIPTRHRGGSSSTARSASETPGPGFKRRASGHKDRTGTSRCVAPRSPAAGAPSTSSVRLNRPRSPVPSVSKPRLSVRASGDTRLYIGSHTKTGGSQRCLRGYSYSSSCLSCWRSSALGMPSLERNERSSALRRSGLRCARGAPHCRASDGGN